MDTRICTQPIFPWDHPNLGYSHPKVVPERIWVAPEAAKELLTQDDSRDLLEGSPGFLLPWRSH